MSSYSFPIQSAKEIVAFLRSCYSDVEITESDIRFPERKVWQKVYTLMLLDCCPQLTPEHLNQIPVTAEFSHPEIHEAAMPLFNLLRCMQELLPICGINDFKMSDIIAPKANRVIRTMSALMNFRFFQQERFEVYEKLKSENDALQDQRETLLREIEEFKQSINAIKARQAELEVEVDAILKNINEWNEKIRDLHPSILAKQRESSDNKVLIAELKSNLIRYKEELIQAKEQNAKLAAKIVPSPDRMKDEMERMQCQLSQAEQTKHNLESRLAELTKRYQLLQERDHDADVALRSVEAIQQENEKQKKVLADISNIQDESANKRTEIKHLDANIQQLTLQITNKQEKMEKLSIQHNMKMNDKKATLSHLENELANIQQEYGEQHSQSIMMENEIKNVKDKQQEEMLEYKDTMTAMTDKHKELLEALDSYNQRFGESCQKLMSAD